MQAFDCTATAPPDRRTPLPSACATDPACSDRMLSAHRGAGVPGVLAPEDSLSAFRAAIAIGADYSECDVRLSSDGVLVVIHDDSVDRTTDGSGNVADMTAAELAALSLNASSYEGDFSCDTIPLLSDVLTLVTGRIHLIVDGSKIGETAPIIAAVDAANAFDWVIYDNTDFAKVQEAAAADSRLHFAVRATSQSELDTRLAAVAPRLPAYVHIENTDPSSIAGPVHAAGQRVFALGFGTDLSAGLSEDASLYESVYASGVDVIQSNRPDLVAQHLNR